VVTDAGTAQADPSSSVVQDSAVTPPSTNSPQVATGRHITGPGLTQEEELFRTRWGYAAFNAAKDAAAASQVQ
jgi:hypothetical protein